MQRESRSCHPAPPVRPKSPPPGTVHRVCASMAWDTRRVRIHLLGTGTPNPDPGAADRAPRSPWTDARLAAGRLRSGGHPPSGGSRARPPEPEPGRPHAPPLRSRQRPRQPRDRPIGRRRRDTVVGGGPGRTVRQVRGVVSRRIRRHRVLLATTRRETLRPEIDVDPFPATGELTVVHEGPSATVEAVLVDHGPMEAAVGYRISSDAGVVAISGDTVVCPGVRLLADHADVLIHEALLSSRVDRAALEWNASATSVGALASTRPSVSWS